MTSNKENNPVEAEKIGECTQIPEGPEDRPVEEPKADEAVGGEAGKGTENVNGGEVGEAGKDSDGAKGGDVGEASTVGQCTAILVPAENVTPSLLEQLRIMKREVDNDARRSAENDDSDSSSGSDSPAWNAPRPFARSDDMYRNFPERDDGYYRRNGFVRRPGSERRGDGNA